MVMLRDFLLLLLTASLAAGLGWLGISALISKEETRPPAQTRGTEYLFDRDRKQASAPPSEPTPNQARSETAQPLPSPGLEQEAPPAPPGDKAQDQALQAAQARTAPPEPAPAPAVTVDEPAVPSAAETPETVSPPPQPPPVEIAEETLATAPSTSGSEPASSEEPPPAGAGTEVSVARVREVEAVSPKPKPLVEEPPLREDQGRIIAKLLAEAERDMRAHRLTTPKERNARDKFQRILALDPSNQEARQGLETIVHKYLWLARQSMNSRLWARAGRFIARAEKVLPEDPRIPPLKRSLARKKGGG